MISGRKKRETKDGRPRAARYDAENDFGYYLFKSVSIIYPTYQIRLLAYLAFTENKRLVIRVPESCKLSDEFNRFRESIKYNDGRHVVEVTRFA